MRLIKIIGFCFLMLINVAMIKAQSTDLMPIPQSIEYTDGSFILKKEFTVSIEGNPENRIYSYTNNVLTRLKNRTGLFMTQGYLDAQSSNEGADMTIVVNRPGQVKFGEDESYQLEITPEGISLDALTDIGAIRGLETFLQLVASNESEYYFPAIKISDRPRFQWRGLMIDVSRHFQPVDVIKRNIDGLAAVKMNVLHMHLSDDQGFRVESKVFPELTSKGSDGYFYTQEQIKDIVDYADQRGIRVYPEFDVPGHASAILTAFPELASKDEEYSIERNAGIFDPTLDPTNPKTYEFLEALFAEMAPLFKDEYFHIGGDENEARHWDGNERIQEFMRKNDIKDNHELQAYFNAKLLNKLTALNKKMVGWDEIIHENLPNDAIIQSWRGLENMELAVKKGYKTMLSNGFYIDLMHSAEDHYLIDPLPDTLDLTEEEKKNIIGGEATMWSELVTPHTIDSRIWPRTAAIAERLWSDKSVNDVEDMYRRLAIISIQLEKLGLTHLSSRDMILRSMVQNENVQALRTLADVCQPLQGYTRNPEGTMYQSYSPFMLFADACIADPPDAYEFNLLVEKYLKGNKENLNSISNYLSRWSANHNEFNALLAQAPLLKDISALSANLSLVANIGAEALTYIQESKSPNTGWIEKSKKTLNEAREQGGRTELRIIDSIEKLLSHSSSIN